MDLARDRGSLPAGIPGWRRARCLGCGQRVVQARDGHVTIGGTRDGSYLWQAGAEPMLSRTTDLGGPPDAPLLLLGVAHTSCADRALNRIRAGAVELSDDLPTVHVEQGDHLPEIDYNLHRPVTADRCPFCDSADDLSDEHIWPLWFSRLLSKRGVKLKSELTTRGRIEITVPVCMRCNTTWMSVLENDSRDVLVAMFDSAVGQAPALTVDPLQQSRLAAWAVKTAFLIDTYSDPVIPRGFLHEFALNRTPNESTAVWMGGFSSSSAAQALKQAKDFPGPGGRASNNSPNGIVVTFTILDVLFQVVTHFNSGPINVAERTDGYRAGLLQIWPARPSHHWPPTLGYSRDSWDGLISSIR